MQPDTIIPDLSNPQGWNRYSYVTNRPVNFNDPTGHSSCDQISSTSARAACENGGYGEAQKQLDLEKEYKKGNDPCLGLEGLNNDICRRGKEQKENGYKDYLPDYVTLNIAAPFFIPGVGPDFQITRDYYGQWYGALGIYTGLPGVSVFGGEILEKGRPTTDKLEGFITKDSFSFGGGMILGGGATWGNVAVGDDGVTWDDFAVEAGFSTPGGAGMWTYGKKMEDIYNGAVDLFDNVKYATGL